MGLPVAVALDGLPGRFVNCSSFVDATDLVAQYVATLIVAKVGYYD
ncbi:MAG: hypothetical protein ACI8UP_005070 [Porticoccaceae bacterium]|jgi:hypothetical protein